MSAKGRKTVQPDGSRVATPRRANDCYETPAWAVDFWLRCIESRGVVLAQLGRILEPAAGSGRVVRGLLDRGCHPGAVSAIEIDAGRARQLPIAVNVACADALDGREPAWPAADLVITNPPFSLAAEFIERSFDAARRAGAGLVSMLLRLAYLEGQKRLPFWRSHPADVYPLPRRPSFTDDGATDQAAYAVFVWEVPHREPHGRIVYL